MKAGIILKVLSYVYATFLRELVKDAIDNPNKEWDDTVLELLDRLFGYTGTE